MTRTLSDTKLIDGIPYKKCLNPKHIGDRYVLLDKMTKRKGRPVPYGSNCLVCFNQYNRKDRDTDEKRLKANKRSTIYNRLARIKNGMAWSLWKSCKNRAARKGIHFSISSHDVVIPEKCPILGITLIQDPSFIVNNSIKGQLTLPNYPTIDRLVPELGYTKDNIAVISWRANDLKGNASLQELQSVVDWLKLQHLF